MKNRESLFCIIIILMALLPTGCRQCLPLQGARPSPSAAVEENIASVGEGIKIISLTREQMKEAGVKTAVLAYRPVNEKLCVTGELKADPLKEVKITSRFSGKVSQILIHEGDKVDKGEPLAVLESIELTQADAAFHQAGSELDTSRKHLARVRDMAKLGVFSKSAIEDAQNNAAAARALSEEGKAATELAQKQYDRIHELQALGLASMKDLEIAESDLKKARAEERKNLVNLSSAKSRLKREELNYSRGHLMYKEVYDAEEAYRQAASRYQGARAALRVLGVDERNHGEAFTITSPFAGIVSALNISQGEAIVPTTPLMTVTNTDVLWLLADIYEKDLRKINICQPAECSVSACPHEIFKGRVSAISPKMNEKTRTVKARIQITNKSSLLKVNMFAQVCISVGGARQALLVPVDAVQKSGDQDLVYVRHGGLGEFTAAPVTCGDTYGGMVEIRKGVSPGSEIAVQGAFMIRSEESKSSLGGDD